MAEDELLLRWKLHEVTRTFARLENDLHKYAAIIQQLMVQDIPISNKWQAINPLLQNMNISIRKNPERITDEDLLSGQELFKRWNRSCGNPVCLIAHCTECGSCGHKYEDGNHECKRPQSPFD